MIVLDTHTWIWWANETGQITEAQRDAIVQERRQIAGQTHSNFRWPDKSSFPRKRESIQIASRQLTYNQATWIPAFAGMTGTSKTVHLLPLTPEIAVRAYRLPEPFHRDPADRILVATALEHSCSLVTSDARVTDYPHVQTIRERGLLLCLTRFPVNWPAGP